MKDHQSNDKNYMYNQGLPDKVAAEVNRDCYLVSRGAKPCSVIGIELFHTKGAAKVISAWGLFSHLDDTHEVCPQLHIFKHEAYRPVIEELTKENLPLSEASRHWINGKLFGYSDEAIAEFLARFN